MKPSEYLIKARGLIDRPEKWIQNMSARGNRFCSIGALKFAAVGSADGLPTFAEYRSAKSYLLGAIPPDYYPSIVHYNDGYGRTHSEIMALFDRAIGKAQNDEMWAELKQPQPEEQPSEPVMAAS